MAGPAGDGRAQASEDASPQPAAEDFSKPMGPPDPFNRGTPRGSMYGFLTAARARDFERAAEYLTCVDFRPTGRTGVPIWLGA